MSKSSKELVRYKLMNPVYSHVLYHFNTHNLSVTELSKKVKKSYPVLLEQVWALEKDGFLICEEHPAKFKNQKKYSINWEKITKEFIAFLQKKSNKEILKSNVIENIVGNVFLQGFFKRTFEEMTQCSEIDKNEKVTIQALFEYVVSQTFVYTRYDLAKHKNITTHYNPMDFFSLAKMKIDLLMENKTLSNQLRANDNPLFLESLTEEERQSFIKKFEKTKLSQKLLDDLYVFVYLLPNIFVTITKNQIFEKAFLHSTGYKYTAFEDYDKTEKALLDLALRRSKQIHKKEYKHELRKMKKIFNQR